MRTRQASVAVERLRSATVSKEAPSARNLLVTVFGDAILPHGHDIGVSVGSLANLLEAFGVNERLVRTSLTRLVNDGLLATRSSGRRSYYHVAADAVTLFEGADRRIYESVRRRWDHTWTLVVIDGAEGTTSSRARLRQRLTWAGLGAVAPNVMASPVVTPDEAAQIVEQVGDVRNVLVSRAELHDGVATIDEAALVRRCAPIDDIAARYDDFVGQFEVFDAVTVERLSAADAFKLRTWLIAGFRRVALVDPLLPAELLPEVWSGGTARALVAELYAACTEASEEHLAATAELDRGSIVAAPETLAGRFRVG